MNKFGERLRKAREDSNLSQAELAEKIGIKPSSGVISNWERDLNKPDADKIVKLCEVLNISASYLLDYYGKSDFQCTLSEQDHIKKYRSLDSYGKRVINAALDIEFERCTAEPDPIGYNRIIGFTDVINAKRFLDANSILYTAALNGAEMNDDEIIALANETYKNGSYRE